jgi:voltage-gated potassium channel
VLRYTLRYLRTLFGALADPQVRPYLVAAANLIAVGTIFYTLVEGWDLLDAAYFCVITLATVGFGDLTPVTRLGKVFTMIYIITGLGVLSAFIGAMTRVSIQRTQDRHRTHSTPGRWRRHPGHRHEHEPATVSTAEVTVTEDGTE